MERFCQNLQIEQISPSGFISTREDFVINEESLKAGATFALQYIDSMTNEYIQEYSVKEEYSTIDIECGYPKLLEQ